MTIVAVAGGTGNVGRTIVEALVASGKHEVKIISRKPNPDLEAEIGVPILAVDYSDVNAVVKLLEDNNVHTVISGIAMHSPDGTAPHEIELIQAADRSKATKRLISSEWGLPQKEKHIDMIPSAIHKINAMKELRKTKNLEYTVFHNGYFMDYWGFPGVKSNLARMPLVLFIDVANNTAAIPGSGNTPAIFTHTTDVARFVAASLDLPKWEEETFIYGDRVTLNEFLHLAEDAKGTKFTVTHDSVEKLKSGQVTELPGQVPLYQFVPKAALDGLAAAFGLLFDNGDVDMNPQSFLNERFPEIKPLKVKEMLDKAWRKS